MNKVGEKAFPYFFEVQRADILAQSDYRRDEKLALVDAYENVYNEIIKAKDCFTLKDLAVNGRDLIERGINPGPDFKRILDEMLSDVIDNPEHNDKAYLMSTYVK
jgi:tRNA nucleotidyltransferase (CCA-adding enzyme)